MWKFLIAFLIGEEPCHKCEVLKEQLEYERSQNQELISVLTAQLKPQVIVSETTELKPIHNKFRTFSRRRDELEREARIRAEKLNSPLAGKVDAENNKNTQSSDTKPLVDQLEMELGIVDSDSDESERVN